MNRQAWTDVARALGVVRSRLLEHAERGNRRAHMERAIGVDLAARAICSTLRARSPRFDARRFMLIVAAPKK